MQCSDGSEERKVMTMQDRTETREAAKWEGRVTIIQLRR